jgi:hypothetical protein
VLYLAWVRHLDPILGTDVGWWWVLAPMVFVTERWPVELEFRRSAHSFSLTDVPSTLDCSRSARQRHCCVRWWRQSHGRASTAWRASRWGVK